MVDKFTKIQAHHSSVLIIEYLAMVKLSVRIPQRTISRTMLIVMVLMIPRLVLGNLKTSEVIKRIKYCTEGHQKQSLLSEMFNETPSGTDKTELNNNGNELKEKLDHLCLPYLHNQFSSYELLKLLAIPIQQQLRNVAGAQSIWLQQGVRLSVALSIFQI